MSKWVNQFRSKVKKMLPHSRKRVLDETYDIKDTLGGGLFSVVKKAVNRKTGELVAIKIYDKSRLNSYDRECTTTEVELLKSLKHPNIITVKDCIDTRSKLYLVEELMAGGDLLELIRKKKSFPEKEACRLFTQILTALAYLHSNGIAHRDIKPDNILVSGDTDEPIVKMADFGFAKKVGSGILHTPCGSPVYAAPEIAREETYDKSVDVWSSGVLLYILLCGYPPFYHRDPDKLFDEIKKAVFDFPAKEWNAISDPAKDLVSSMLRADPTERITAQQALEHPWMVLMRTEPNAPKPDTPPPTPPPFASFISNPRLSSSPHSQTSLSRHASSTSSISHHLSTTSTSTSPSLSRQSSNTTASAADSVMDRKLFKIRVNKALDHGSQFHLGNPTSSTLWERRRKSKLEKSEKIEKEKFEKFEKREKRMKARREKNDKSDRSDRSESDKSEKSKSEYTEKSCTTTTRTGGEKETEENRKRGVGIMRSDSKESREDSRSEDTKVSRENSRSESRREDSSEMGTIEIEAYSLSRTCSDASSEDGFSFLNNHIPCE